MVPEKKDLAIKNYPLNSAKISPQAKDVPRRANTAYSKSNAFFGENMTIAEIEKLEKVGPNKEVNMSPVYYLNTPPPGLTPTRYGQKTYNFSEGGNKTSSPNDKSRLSENQTPTSHF
mmetsp:Transcript_24547/g.21728  ORF Transcript_24547/g.21728 Transcript_24547/m.21728 type:complete len:117 (-) Transcript_24547:775-1125(-)